MTYSFSKDKKPRGASWPLRRSLLDAELEKASIMDSVSVVTYSCGRPSRDENPLLLSLHRYGDKSPVLHPGRVSITLRCVSSDLRREAEQRLLEVFLPQACRWIAQIPSRPETWRTENAHIIFRLQDTPLTEPHD